VAHVFRIRLASQYMLSPSNRSECTIAMAVDLLSWCMVHRIVHMLFVGVFLQMGFNESPANQNVIKVTVKILEQLWEIMEMISVLKL